MALIAPRSLNEPVICSFSSLRYMSPPAILLRGTLWTSGVRRMRPSSLRLAARTSAGRRSANAKAIAQNIASARAVAVKERQRNRGEKLLEIGPCYLARGLIVQLDELGAGPVDWQSITAAPLAGPFPCW